MVGVVLITGGTRGLGFGIAEVLASNGYDLILAYHSNTNAANTSKHLLMNKYPNIKVEIIAGNSYDIDNTIDSYLHIINKSFNNKLIAVVHNAGGFPGVTTKSVFNNTMRPPMPGTLKTAQDYQWVDYYIKIYGLMFMKLLEQCAPLMKWRKHSGGGRFIFISSPGCNATQSPSSGYITPGSGKSFGEYLVRQYAKVYASEHITVNCIIPGVIKTDAWRSYKDKKSDKAATNIEDLENFKKVTELTPMHRYGNPTEVGHLAAYLISKNALFLTGVSIPFDGGLHLGPMSKL